MTEAAYILQHVPAAAWWLGGAFSVSIAAGIAGLLIAIKMAAE